MKDNARVESDNLRDRRLAVAGILSMQSMTACLVFSAFRMWNALWLAPLLGVALALLTFRRTVHKIVLMASCLVISVTGYLLGPPVPGGGLSELSTVLAVPVVIAIFGASLLIAVRDRDA